VPRLHPRTCAPRALLISLIVLTLGEGALAAEHVIHISVDGLHPGHLQTAINAGNAPNFKRFQDEGAWTNNARTDYSHTNTLPNHTSMITGRPVTKPDAIMLNTVHHGYTDNGNPLSTWTLHNQGNLNVPYKASTFDVAHDAGLSTGLYASKNKFVIYEQSYNATTGADHPNGRDKIDTFFGPESTPMMPARLLTDLAADHFNYTFLHYADTDDAGHGSGWGSPTWFNALATIDGYLGDVFELIEEDPVLAGRTAIVLSADHGGTGTGHSTATNPANYTIPFFVWGAGVGRGDLYAMNADMRTNPGTSRIAYGVPGQPIRNGDGGNLALSLLGLDPIPGGLINLAQDLRVATPGDYDYSGVVDAADYTIWQDTLGSTTALAADGDASGTVDTGDFDVWKTNFGTVGGGAIISAADAAVPEPASIMLLLVGLAALRRFGRR
jgi:hypothetical protein